MKNFLFPRIFRGIGWVMFLLGFMAGISLLFGHQQLYIIPETIVNNLVIVMILSGGVFITCSKDRDEDEMSMAIRLQSLLLTFYFYTLMAITGVFLFNSIDFLIFLIGMLVCYPGVFIIILGINKWRIRRLG